MAMLYCYKIKFACSDTIRYVMAINISQAAEKVSIWATQTWRRVEHASSIELMGEACGPVEKLLEKGDVT